MNNVDLSAGLGFVANDIVRPIIEPSRVRISDQNGFTTGIDHNSSPETSLPSKRGLAIRQARAKPLAGEHCMALIGVPSSDLRGCVALSDSPSPRPSFHTRLGLCTAALARGSPPAASEEITTNLVRLAEQPRTHDDWRAVAHLLLLTAARSQRKAWTIRLLVNELWVAA
jgi:hypothetical protein